MDESDDPPVSMVRPFLGKRPADLDTGLPAPEHGEREDDVGVRPYYLTGGRTQSANDRVSFETVVVRGQAALTGRDRFERERLAIVELSAEPQSMAELSAKLRLPIGVICVLCGDLAEHGVLHVNEAPVDVADDVELINLLIDVLRQL
jgi:Protein of unknown function (DUF742)